MAVSSSALNDDVFVVTEATRFVDGGDGVDTLDFGRFQASWRYLWNSQTASGGTYDVTDPLTGISWQVAFQNIESLVGSPSADRLVANAQITSLYGGAGDDTLIAATDSPNPSYLRGGEGADWIIGGDTFDDINGNQGNDTAFGYGGADWVLGGQGHDVLFGGEGADFVHGNLGNDTVDGGSGDDTVLGGQGDDVVLGGTGGDFLSGDRGDDTLTGGGGADTFRAFDGGGDDRILDFDAAGGDRVRVDAGSTYALSQSLEGATITFASGDAVVLTGVSLSGLPAGEFLRRRGDGQRRAGAGHLGDDDRRVWRRRRGGSRRSSAPDRSGSLTRSGVHSQARRRPVVR